MLDLLRAAPDLPGMPDSASWPRLMTGRHPRAVGTYGPEIAAWALERPRMHVRPLKALRWWQNLGLGRAFEHDADGRLVWRTVIISGPRQVGKSYLERIACGWRLHQAERFGGPQDVLHVAHKLVGAQEVWRPAARWATATYGREAVRWANGEQKIEIPDGGRWMIQAANEGAGVAFSLSMILVDEAWSVSRTVVDAALSPTLAEAEQPQIWLVSTAGDARSDLMAGYRALALGLEEPGDGDDILLIEWSAPPDPDLDIDDPEVWRAASPHWDERRRAAVAEARRNVGELEFRHQWLNQWVTQLSPPLFDPAVWPAARWDDLLPTGRPTFGVDVAADRSAAWILATVAGVVEVVDTRAGVSWVPDRLTELAEAWDPPAIGIDGTGPGATIADQMAGTEAAARLVVLTGRQMTTAAGEAYDAICDGRVRARAHEDLDRAVMAARRRSVGQSWTFARQVGDVSCSPLLAAVAGLWAADHAPEAVEVSQIW
jgi:hypothetical protein